MFFKDLLLQIVRKFIKIKVLSMTKKKRFFSVNFLDLV